MSSPWNNLIKSTHERTSAPYDIGMEVVVISFTDRRYISAWKEIQLENGEINICGARSDALWTNRAEYTF